VRFDEEAGQAITTVLDGGAAFRGDPTQNPQLQHNDVIIMNRSFLARLTYGINVFTQPFRDILGFLLFFDSLGESAEDLCSVPKVHRPRMLALEIIRASVYDFIAT
jgi:polysaccharide export outer membrane protein